VAPGQISSCSWTVLILATGCPPATRQSAIFSASDDTIAIQYGGQYAFEDFDTAQEPFDPFLARTTEVASQALWNATESDCSARYLNLDPSLLTVDNFVDFA
jgi:hypothetical protein